MTIHSKITVLKPGEHFADVGPRHPWFGRVVKGLPKDRRTQSPLTGFEPEALRAVEIIHQKRGF